MEKKEIEEFLIRLGGAMLGGLEDAAFEGYWKAGQPGTSGKFPYIQLHPKLPPCDDLIVGGLSIPPWVIGTLMEEDGKKRGDIKAQETGKTLKTVGEGNVCYSGPMVIQQAIRWGMTPTIGPVELGHRVAATLGAGEQGQRTDVGHKIHKL